MPEHVFGSRTVDRPLFFHVTTIKKQAGRFVLFYVCGPKNLRELAQAATAGRPALKVLFTTGYASRAVARGGVIDPGIDMIGKPFTLKEIALKIREVLSGAPAAAPPADLVKS